MLFIPSGFDTVDLINIATGIQNPSAGSYKKHFDPNAAFVVSSRIQSLLLFDQSVVLYVTKIDLIFPGKHFEES